MHQTGAADRTGLYQNLLLALVCLKQIVDVGKNVGQNHLKTAVKLVEFTVNYLKMNFILFVFKVEKCLGQALLHL